MNGRKTPWGLLGGLALLAAALRLYGIGSQVPTGDDMAVAIGGRSWVVHGLQDPLVAYHPPLRNLLEFVSTWLFGHGAIGVKGWSLLLGTLSVPLLALIVDRLTRNRLAAGLAAGLLAIDIVHIDYSRQAIQEVHTTFFMLLGVWLVVEVLACGDVFRWRWLLPLAGLAFGLAVASKPHGLPPLLVSAGLLLWWAWRRRRGTEAVFVLASLLLLPALVYFLTYLPWFSRGYGLVEWFGLQRWAATTTVVHSKPLIGYLAFDRPELWFVRPFMGYVDTVVSAAGTRQVAVAVGNPLVWMAVLPAAAYSLYFKRGQRSHQVLQLLFWGSYLPLALSPRPVWVLSANAVTPFAFAILGVVLADLVPRVGARAVYAYAAAAVLAAAALYPLAIGRALEYPHLDSIVGMMGDYANAQFPFNQGR